MSHLPTVLVLTTLLLAGCPAREAGAPDAPTDAAGIGEAPAQPPVPGVDSPHVRLEPDVGHVMWGETDVGLEVTTRLAQERGVRTLLKPHVERLEALHRRTGKPAQEVLRRWFGGGAEATR